MLPFFLDELQGTHSQRRADQAKLKQVFDKHASVVKDGERYMTHEDFIRRFLKLFTHDNYNKQTVAMLGGILDTSKDGYDRPV